MSDELLPCPFCGNDGGGAIEHALHVAHSQADWHPGYDAYNVQCDKCTATMGYSESAEDAITGWNTRSALVKRDVLARTIALHGLGTVSGLVHREPPNSAWSKEEWEKRILECVPERVEQQCYALADAIISLAPGWNVGRHE